MDREKKKAIKIFLEHLKKNKSLDYEKAIKYCEKIKSKNINPCDIPLETVSLNLCRLRLEY